jgi:hypothetical protein
MAIASLSPNSVSASPIQVNPQVKTDLQSSAPQVAEDAQRVAKAVKTDTITISPQALKMADDKDAAAKEAAMNKADEQRALQLELDKAKNAKNETQRIAVKAYATDSSNQ